MNMNQKGAMSLNLQSPQSGILFRFFEVRPQYDEATGEAVGFRYTDLRTDSTYIIAYAMWYAL